MARVILTLLAFLFSEVLFAQLKKEQINSTEIRQLIFDLQKAQLLPDTLNIAASPYIFNIEEKEKLISYNALQKSERAFFLKQLNNQTNFSWAKINLSNAYFISDNLLKTKYVPSTDSIKRITAGPWDDYFSISKPIFSKDKKLAFVRITVYHQCESVCGEGALFILKKLNNKWTLMEKK